MALGRLAFICLHRMRGLKERVGGGNEVFFAPAESALMAGAYIE